MKTSIIPSMKKPNALKPTSKEKRHTISFDLSDDAYGLVQAYTKIDGYKSPADAALASLQRDVYAMMSQTDENEFRELFGLPKRNA
jgi:hypothetical protein